MYFQAGYKIIKTCKSKLEYLFSGKKLNVTLALVESYYYKYHMMSSLAVKKVKQWSFLAYKQMMDTPLHNQ